MRLPAAVEIEHAADAVGVVVEADDGTRAGERAGFFEHETFVLVAADDDGVDVELGEAGGGVNGKTADDGGHGGGEMVGGGEGGKRRAIVEDGDDAGGVGEGVGEALGMAPGAIERDAAEAVAGEIGNSGEKEAGGGGEGMGGSEGEHAGTAVGAGGIDGEDDAEGGAPFLGEVDQVIGGGGSEAFEREEKGVPGGDDGLGARGVQARRRVESFKNEFVVAGRERGDIERATGGGMGGGGERGQRTGVEGGGELGGKRGHIADVNDESFDAVADEISGAAAPAGDGHGAAGGERFHDDQGPTFGGAGEDKDVGFGVEVTHLRNGHRAEEASAAGLGVRAQRGLKLGTDGSVAGDREYEGNARGMEMIGEGGKIEATLVDVVEPARVENAERRGRRGGRGCDRRDRNADGERSTLGQARNDFGNAGSDGVVHAADGVREGKATFVKIEDEQIVAVAEGGGAQTAMVIEGGGDEAVREIVRNDDAGAEFAEAITHEQALAGGRRTGGPRQHAETRGFDEGALGQAFGRDISADDERAPG